MDEEDNYRDLLEKYHVEIVQSLDLDRQYILSHLRSKQVFDEEDTQIILNAGPSRQQKAVKFIDVLATKGPNAVDHFVQALEIEHPHLYEVFTGKQATERSYNQTPSQVIPWAVLSDKQLLDFEREYLVKELVKISESNQKMAYMQEKLIKEKNILERKCDEVTRALEERDLLVHELQEAIQQKHNTSHRVNNNTDKLSAFVRHSQEILRDHVEKSNIIITLQSQQLAKSEELDTAKNRLEELRKKNANLMQQVRDLTMNYDWQRSRSKRLSAQVDENNKVIKQSSDTKKETYQLKLQLSHVTEERDKAVNRLDEVRTVMAAMNASHEILKHEKYQEAEKRDQVTGNFFRVNEKLQQLELELIEEKSKGDTARRKNVRYVEEIETFKEQRDFYLAEREHAIRSREQAIKERDDTMRFNGELQRTKEEMLKKQLKNTFYFEKKTIEVSEELERYKTELEEAKKTILILEQKEINHQIKETFIDDKDSEINTEQSREEQDTIEDLQVKWRDRTLTAVLQSAMKMLHGKDSSQTALKNLGHSEMPFVYGSLAGDISPVADMLDILQSLFNKSENKEGHYNEEEKAETKSLPVSNQNSRESSPGSPSLPHRKLARQGQGAFSLDGRHPIVKNNGMATNVEPVSRDRCDANDNSKKEEETLNFHWPNKNSLLRD